MVRLEGIRTASRDPRHFVERHRRDPRRRLEKAVDAGDRLEVPELMRDVRDAVVVEDQPRLQLRLRFRQLRRR